VLNEVQLASNDSIIELAAVMGRIGCRRVSHLWDKEASSWKDLSNKLDRVRGLTNKSLSLVNCFLQQIAHATLEDQHISTTAGHWRWSNQTTETLETLLLLNKRVYLFLVSQEFNHHRLNSIWGVTLDEGEWRSFWQALWQLDLTTKGKVFLWRVLAQGLFTGSQALKIQMGDGCCLASPGTIKTVLHLLHSCPHAKSVWTQCWPLLYGCAPPATFAPNFLNMIRDQLRQQFASTAHLFLLYQSGWQIWLGRNAMLFNQKPQSYFLDLVLAEAALLLTSVSLSLPPGTRNTRLKQARDEIDRWSFPRRHAAP
jgi:hypothetical protein